MNLAALRSDTRFLVFGDRTNTSFSDTDCDRYLNQGHKKCVIIAMSANGDWQVNGIYATKNIQAGVCKYDLDISHIKINEVYFKRTPTGKYEKATQVDPALIGQESEDYRPATPEFDLRGNKIVLFQDADFVDIPNGLKIRLQKDALNLTSDTDEPELIEAFQDFITTFAAWKYCLGNEMYNKARELKRVLYGDPTLRDDKGIKGDITTFYANRSTAKPSILEPAEENNY